MLNGTQRVFGALPDTRSHGKQHRTMERNTKQNNLPISIRGKHSKQVTKR